MIEMKRKQYKRLGCALTCVAVIVELIIIIGMLVLDIGDSDPSIQETNIIWVDFDVAGTLRVEIPDTNCGEVPDEAWEEARRVLGEFGNYASLDLSVRNMGSYTEVIVP